MNSRTIRLPINIRPNLSPFCLCFVCVPSLFHPRGCKQVTQRMTLQTESLTGLQQVMEERSVQLFNQEERIHQRDDLLTKVRTTTETHTHTHTHSHTHMVTWFLGPMSSVRHPYSPVNNAYSTTAGGREGTFADHPPPLIMLTPMYFALLFWNRTRQALLSHQCSV